MTDPKKPAAPVVDVAEFTAAEPDLATSLATAILGLDWKARRDWTVEEQADRHGQLQEMIAAALAQQPRTEPAGEAVAALMKAIQRAEEGAGTLPAKEAVKLRPDDWHAVCRLARALSPLKGHGHDE